MSYHDQFEDADVLDSMSWAIMSYPARVMKLAYLFLERESIIRSEHRNWKGPTVSNVRPFVKSYFVPPRGQGKAMIEMVVKAIEYQRGIRNKRAANVAYAPITAKSQNTTYATQTRRNRVAARHYSIRFIDRWKKLQKADISCSAIGAVNGIQLMVDRGSGYSHSETYPRIYMEEKATGRTKVVVLEPGRRIGKLESITAALSYIVPKEALQSMFGGDVMTLLFDDEAFLWRGEKTPWQNVRKVYSGKAGVRARKTRGRPKKKE